MNNERGLPIAVCDSQYSSMWVLSDIIWALQLIKCIEHLINAHVLKTEHSTILWFKNLENVGNLCLALKNIQQT